MILRPPRSTLDRSSAASDVYKRQPNDPALHHELGMAYSLDNQYENSISSFLTVIRLDSHFRDVYDHLAWSHIKLGQYEHADRALTPVSYTHLRAHETVLDLVCRLLLEKKKNL